MKTSDPLRMSDKMMELVARRFRLLGDVTRLRILQALEDGGMNVSAITEQVAGTQPNISKHLQSLTDAGILDRKRDGNSILYSIADSMIFKLCALVCQSTTSSVRVHYGDLFGNNKGSRR